MDCQHRYQEEAKGSFQLRLWDSYSYVPHIYLNGLKGHCTQNFASGFNYDKC